MHGHTAIVKYFLAVCCLYLAMGTLRLDDMDRLTSADVMRQLSKEARGVHGSRAKFSAALGEPDDTIGRYFRGEREMPADLLFRAIELVNLSEAEFFARARATRAQRRATDAP